MPANVSLNLFELNTDTVTVTITQLASGNAEDLTGKEVEVYIKASADTADDDVATTKLSSTVADEVDIINALSGQARFQVPASVVAAPGSMFWRVDVTGPDVEDRRTALYGPVSITNL